MLVVVRALLGILINSLWIGNLTFTVHVWIDYVMRYIKLLYI